MAQQQVVGYDPDTGRAVIGYDPNTGKAVFQQAQTQPPTAPPQESLRDRMNRTPVLGAPTIDRNNLPAIASVGAAYATGGLSIPIQMAATGAAGAVGQGIKDASTDMPVSDRFSNMAFEGLKQMGIQGVTATVAQAAPRMMQLARSLWGGAAKITEPVAKSTQTMRMGGSLDQAKDEIAETVLSQGVGTLRKGNVERMRDALNAMDNQVDAIIANSDKLVSRREIADAIRAHMDDFTRDTAPGLIQRDALDAAARMLNKRPPRMTVQEAQKAKREIYQFYQKSFPAGSAETATAMAEKTKGRALREAVATAEPRVAPINAEMSRQIPAVSAMEKAVSRTSNHSAFSLSTMLAGVSGNPGVLAAALMNNPKVGSFTAQQLYNAAKRLPSGARTAANIIRMASMGSDGGPVASHETGRD
jgi:hypothetical protein